MTRKYELTTWERMTLLQVVNVQRGDVRRLRRLISLVGVLEMSPDERAEVGWREDGERITWLHQNKTFEVVFSEADFEVLRQVVTAYDGWQVGAGGMVLALMEKLGLE